MHTLARRDDEARQRAWRLAHAAPRQLIDDSGVVNVSRAVQHLDWLIEQLDRNEQERRELERVRPLVVDATTYVSWIDDLREEFVLLPNRYSRHRNAIVHGGPLNEEAVQTILLFVDALAVDTLAATLDGGFARRPLIQHFAERRAAYVTWREELLVPGVRLHERIGISGW